MNFENDNNKITEVNNDLSGDNILEGIDRPKYAYDNATIDKMLDDAKNEIRMYI